MCARKQLSSYYINIVCEHRTKFPAVIYLFLAVLYIVILTVMIFMDT